MVNDILDILNPKARFTATGKFYKRRPIGADDGSIEFNYEYVNPYSSTWKRLFGNVQTESGETAIRSNDQLDAVPNESYVILQDGTVFKVLEVQKDFQAANKQVLRLFGTPVSVEYVLRLVRVENPWGL